MGLTTHGGCSNSESGVTRPKRTGYKTVFSDLKEFSFKIGYRAVRLIEKLISGPLWKRMANENLILRMSSHYQNLLELLESSREDYIEFLRGESFCDPSFTNNRDECLKKLLKPSNEQTKVMAKQYLEIVFVG